MDLLHVSRRFTRTHAETARLEAARTSHICDTGSAKERGPALKAEGCATSAGMRTGMGRCCHDVTTMRKEERERQQKLS
jgi:hypothetical protein